MSRSNADILRQQRRAENVIRSRPITQVATIGQRSNNGRYDVVMPDGGIMAGRADKIYNAKHDAGDTVITIPRRDGVILIDGPKATVEPDPKVNPLDQAALVDRCDGYLNGQVFNCAEAKRKIFGKLKILYTYDGALWIGGDRPTPTMLDTGLAIDSALTFNNLGNGDNYILSGFDPANQRVATIRSGGKTLAPNGFEFSLTDSASFFPPNYFNVPNGLGHGLFINNIADSGAVARYWDGIDDGFISNPDYLETLGQDAGSGDWWIAPGVSRPVTYSTTYDAFGVPDRDENRWGFFFASANLDSIAVWNFIDATNAGGVVSIAHYIYRRSTGQLDAFDGVFNFRQPSNISNFANWVGDRVYGILQTDPIHFDFAQTRDMPIAIWQETAGATISYQSVGTINTQVYAIPATAVVRAYSYHP